MVRRLQVGGGHIGACFLEHSGDDGVSFACYEDSGSPDASGNDSFDLGAYGRQISHHLIVVYWQHVGWRRQLLACWVHCSSRLSDVSSSDHLRASPLGSLSARRHDSFKERLVHGGGGSHGVVLGHCSGDQCAEVVVLLLLLWNTYLFPCEPMTLT